MAQMSDGTEQIALDTMESAWGRPKFPEAGQTAKMGLFRRFRKWRYGYRLKRRQQRKAGGIPNQDKAQEPQPSEPKEQIRTYTKPPKSAKPAKSFTVIALYDFVATQPDECNFSAGDLLEVTDASQTWWVVKNFRTKKRGLIPSNYVTSDMSLHGAGEAWYDVDRMEAERKLLVPGVLCGTYILRPCEQPGSPYCLSVRAEELILDTSAVSFDSLGDLLHFYHSNLIDNEVGLVEARPHRVPPPMSFKECFIDYKDVTLENEVGRGHFGVVYLGSIRSMKVAVKKSLTDTNDEAFREEARVMHILSHQRIVRFLGFCCNTPDGRVLIITEFMSNGALRDYLQTPEGRSLTYRHLISITDQVVKAMVYLEKVGVVHRDLRAANVLVDGDGSVKVADFGLTKILGFEQKFTASSFPFRWTAPEAMKADYQPNTKADVWSFGVLMFEVLTYGSMPYEECENASKLQVFLSEGKRLSSPRALGYQCDEEAYRIMRSCWETLPQGRPSFQKLSVDIEEVIISIEGKYDACWNIMEEN
ncbi:Tyrosine-protein kinase SPK-1 [Taenia crassiceps]|uniref:non-specific protein-tyrosine kinase n=1 Tax=Taenia crassiceps TaxID=6207 RepID=A0ABR4PZF4_9CEST